jgi:hypothetical protein
MFKIFLSQFATVQQLSTRHFPQIHHQKAIISCLSQHSGCNNLFSEAKFFVLAAQTARFSFKTKATERSRHKIPIFLGNEIPLQLKKQRKRVHWEWKYAQEASLKSEILYIT